MLNTFRVKISSFLREKSNLAKIFFCGFATSDRSGYGRWRNLELSRLGRLEAIRCKHCGRWQHLSQMKNVSFFLIATILGRQWCNEFRTCLVHRQPRFNSQFTKKQNLQYTDGFFSLPHKVIG